MPIEENENEWEYNAEEAHYEAMFASREWISSWLQGAGGKDLMVGVVSDVWWKLYKDIKDRLTKELL